MTEEKTSTETLRALYSGIKDDLARTEARLAEVVRSDNPLVGEINAYLFNQGGKRLRPALLMLSSRLAGNGGVPETADFWAALVEVIHTASLVHDDIVDRTDVRRGLETVHSRWGANITVLLGDYLYIQAISQALRTRRYELVDILAEASERLVEGEILEYAVMGAPELGEDLYFEIIEKKTASLFSASCRIGGLVGGADPILLRRLEEYGRNLGLAFQIVDDVLDYAGRPDELGKPVLTDLREGRITLPLIYALKESDGPRRAEILKAVSVKASDPGALGRIQATVLASGALEEAEAKAATFAARARSALDGLPPSPAAETLSRLAEFILERRI
ncbi:MAG: polyprenyl synthetase family protein [Candidatus Aminicenantes bacterium]|nr:polyprenyl synthetase family protein [Candidatus Aminicenantes bacterium]